MIWCIIGLCVLIPALLVAYSLGYEAGIRCGFNAMGMGTRHDSSEPICGRTMKPIDGIQPDEAQ